MVVGAEVYRAVDETADLSSGDVAYLSLARTRLVGETPPGDAFNPTGRIPAYPRPALLALPHEREVAIDTMFALVVTHSCEIDRQKNLDTSVDHFDCRLTVADRARAGGDVGGARWRGADRQLGGHRGK